MPVSTRSQIKTDPNQNQIDPNQNPLRNPHHGLKEKMRALTLLYEQQKHQQAFKNPPEPQPPRLSSHPSVDLLSCSGKRGGGGGERKESPNVMREKNTNNNNINTVISRTYSLPQPPLYSAKENAGDRAMGLLGPRKAAISTTVARKLSMGAGVEGRGAIGSENLHEMVMENKQLEGRGVIGSKNLQEIVVESKQGGESGGGSRILVFVRLRPLAKKERESGSRCCVRIVNRRDVYLTEFATENDYLRLKRLRGRHFTFDASFPDSTTQLEVYSTT